LVLSWQSHDPDVGDSAHYHVFFDTISPPRLVDSTCADTTFRPTNVATMAQYYWRVTAYDNHGDSAVGPLWQFQTVAPLTVTAPNGGDRLKIYSTSTITWTGGPSIGLSGGGVCELHAAGILAASDSVVIHRSTDDGASWIRLGQATAPGQFVWQVPGPATESARVKIVAYVWIDTLTGTSGRFAIEESLPASGTGVTAPGSGPE
jgi:hypothetical protein